MKKQFVTIILTLAEARALRDRARAGLEEALYTAPDGETTRMIAPATYAAAARAIERLEDEIAEGVWKRG